MQCDGQYIPLPSLQGIAVLNIPSYAGGTNFWGGTKEDDVSIFLCLPDSRGCPHFLARGPFLGRQSPQGQAESLPFLTSYCLSLPLSMTFVITLKSMYHPTASSRIIFPSQGPSYKSLFCHVKWHSQLPQVGHGHSEDEKVEGPYSAYQNTFSTFNFLNLCGYYFYF